MPVDDRAAEGSRHAMPVARARGIDRLHGRYRRRYLGFLHLGIGAVVARGEHGRARTHLETPLRCVAQHPGNAAIGGQEFARRGLGKNRHAKAARAAREMEDISAGIRQRGMHARLAVRQFGHGPVEHDTERFEPAKGVGHGIDQQAPQPVVVREAAGGVQAPEILVVVVAAIENATLHLVWRVRDRDRPDRARRGAAKLRVLFNENDPAAERGSRNGGREPAAAAADHDDIRVHAADGGTANRRI